MIELIDNTTLKIDKTIDDEIVIKKDLDLELDLSKYLNLTFNLTISKKVKSNIYIITKQNAILDININVEEDASVKCFFAFFNRKTNIDIRTNLLGKNSNSNINIISLSNNNISTFNTTINHLNDNTNSIINNSLILNNNSSSISIIKSNIKNKSIDSNSSQTIDALLLDDKSKIEMTPSLFINENEVFANHSSNISRINKDDLYYILSKGISKKDAEKMYILSFLMKQTPIEKKEIIEQMIERTL